MRIEEKIDKYLNEKKVLYKDIKSVAKEIVKNDRHGVNAMEDLFGELDDAKVLSVLASTDKEDEVEITLIMGDEKSDTEHEFEGTLTNKEFEKFRKKMKQVGFKESKDGKNDYSYE